MALAVLLAGCSMPLEYRIASWVLNGISYLSSGKSLSDHALSLAAHEDCAMFRLVKERSLDAVCVPWEPRLFAPFARPSPAESICRAALESPPGRGPGGRAGGLTDTKPASRYAPVPDAGTLDSPMLEIVVSCMDAGAPPAEAAGRPTAGGMVDADQCQRGPDPYSRRCSGAMP